MYGRGKKLSKPKKQKKRNPYISEDNKKLKTDDLEISGHFLKQKKERNRLENQGEKETEIREKERRT